MDIAEILVELRAERARFDKAIKALEGLQTPRRNSRKRSGKKTGSGLIREIRMSQQQPKALPKLAQVIPIRSFGS